MDPACTGFERHLFLIQGGSIATCCRPAAAQCGNVRPLRPVFAPSLAACAPRGALLAAVADAVVVSAQAGLAHGAGLRLELADRTSWQVRVLAHVQPAQRVQVGEARQAGEVGVDPIERLSALVTPSNPVRSYRPAAKKLIVRTLRTLRSAPSDLSCSELWTMKSPSCVMPLKLPMSLSCDMYHSVRLLSAGFRFSRPCSEETPTSCKKRSLTVVKPESGARLVTRGVLESASRPTCRSPRSPSMWAAARPSRRGVKAK